MNTVFLKIQGIDGTTRAIDAIGDSLRRLQKESERFKGPPGKSPFDASLKDVKEMVAIQTQLARGEKAVEQARRATLSAEREALKLERERAKLQEQNNKPQPNSYRVASYNSALKDIARMEKDRVRWNKVVADEISRTDKLTANNKIREFKRAATESIRSLGQIKKAGEQTAKESSSIFSAAFGGSFWGSLGGNIASKFFSALASIPGKVKDIIDESIEIASQRLGAFKGLESIATFKGFGSSEAQEIVKNFRLVKGGIVEIGEASTAMKNLLATNFTLDESRQLFERFSDSAAFGKQQALGFGEAIRGATEGLKNGNSILVDNAGVTKNLSVILREMGKSERDVMNITQDASVRQAIFNGLLRETAGNVGDADKLMKGWTGTTSALTTAKKNLLFEIGQIIITNPELIALIKLTTKSLDEQTESYKKAGSESKKSTASIVTDFTRLALEAYIMAGKIKSSFVEAGNFVAIGLSSVALASHTALLIINKSFNSLLIDPINTAIDGINLLLGVLRQVPTIGGGINLPDIPKIERFKDDQTAADFEAQRLRFLVANIDKTFQKASSEGDKLRESFESLRKETQKQIDIERMSKDPSSADFEGNLIRKRKPEADSSSTSSGGGKGKKSRLEEAGLNELVSNRTKAEFEKALRGLSPSLRSQIIEYADRYGIPTSLALAQIFSESTFNIGAVSPFNKNVGSSAFGLTQQLPATASRVLKRKVTGEMLKNDPKLALTAWGEYMTFLFDRYGDWELATLAYHQGEGTVDKLVGLLDKGKSVEGFFKSRPKGKAYVQKIAALSGLRGDEQFQTSFQADSKEVFERKRLGILERFRSAGAGEVSVEGSIQTQPVERRRTVDEEFIRNLRISLGLETDRTGEADRYTRLIERQRNILGEISATFESDMLRQQEDLVDLEVQFGVLQKQNADANFVRQRRFIAAKREEYDLQQEITNLQDELANSGINDQLKIQAAYLRDILDLRNRELEAIISINRSELEISNSMEISNNKIRARVLEHLAQQKTLNESIADGIIGTYEAVAERAGSALDKLNEKTKGFLSFIIEPAKAIQRNFLTNITKTLVDSLFPGLGTEMTKTNNPIARPIVDEQQKTNKILTRIAAALGGGIPGSTGGSFNVGSILGGILGGGGGYSNAPGVGIYTTPPFNPNFITPPGPANAGGNRTLWDNLKNIFSTNEGGIFGRRGGNGEPGSGSRLGGIMGGIGDIASIAGGLIGGRFGGILSMGGSGASIGANFGPWGAAIGAGVGLIAGLFMGDPKRKIDKKENLPKLKQGFQDAFKEFSDLIADVNALRTDPDGALGKGRELRAAIASGFGIQFQSKKYRKQSQELIRQQLAAIDAQPDGLMEQLKKAVDIAKAAGERQRRILPEFADGGAVSKFFASNFAGLVPGLYDRRDDKLIRVSGNEVVLTPNHWKPIVPYLSVAGVPGFANGGIVPQTMPSASSAPVINLTLNMYEREDGGFDAYLSSEQGERQVKVVINKLKKNKEI